MSISHRTRTAFALVAALSVSLLALAGCGNAPSSKTEATNAVATSAPPERAINFKIGIMTGTVSQGEDEFRAGQMVIKKYGADHVRHVTYPDNFMNEQETVISQLVGLADDPDVKVIIVGQAIPGSIAALRKIKEKRPDIKMAFIEAHEDPSMVNDAADLSIQPDQLARGRTIVQVAKSMGVTDLVHYSFPRHMSQYLLAKRRDIMKEECAKNGIKFHFVTAPDPMGEGGLNATQQFVVEDVPRELKQFRAITKPEARFLTGHSSGGWTSLWLQVTYPDFFGGVWSTSPDPIDFRDFQRIDLYKAGTNMYTDEGGKPRPIARVGEKPMLFYKPFADMEEVLGHGGQLMSFEAVFSPKGSDGKPKRLWDRKTGKIDLAVAKSWEKYDINLVVERNWATLGPKLRGKIHVITGGLDTFYLEGAVKLFKETVTKLGSDAVVEVIPGKDHGTVLTKDLQTRIGNEMMDSFKKNVSAGDR